MEVAGVAMRQPPGAVGIGSSNSTAARLSSRTSFAGISVRGGACGFRDRGHLDFYHNGRSKDGRFIRCGKERTKETKKKSKLLKSLSKDLSTLTQMSDPAQPNLVSDAALVLMKHLGQLRAEEKEQKRKKKEEKAKLKAETMKMAMLDCESSSSSESSDSECEELNDMDRLRNQATAVTVAQPMPDESHLVTLEATSPLSISQAQEPKPINSVQGRSLQTVGREFCNGASISCSGDGNEALSLAAAAGVAFSKRIEVCMGNKCKKSGGAALLEEFEKVVGAKGAVVGCKCMGKCRDGPNARVMNSVDEGVDDSVRTPANPLCIGVGLEDVGVIVANFFGQDGKDLGF